MNIVEKKNVLVMHILNEDLSQMFSIILSWINLTDVLSC